MSGLSRLLGRFGIHIRKSKFTGSMSEMDVHDWLAEAGYRVGDVWTYPPGEDMVLASYVFSEYERRTGFPLSVARGRTGSMGPLCAPRIVDLLGRGHTTEHKHRIVDRLLDAVLESHYWPTAFSVVRQEFEEATP